MQARFGESIVGRRALAKECGQTGMVSFSP